MCQRFVFLDNHVDWQLMLTRQITNRSYITVILNLGSV